MKTTQYICDWCKAERPENEMHDLLVSAARLLPQQIKADICDECFNVLKAFIDSVMKE